jgi:[ribosomal protein S5]-alanine N-acetyltransferase
LPVEDLKEKRERQSATISLLPHTTEHLRALLEGEQIYQERFGIKVADGLRDFLTGPEVSAEFLTRLNDSSAADPWKDGFGVLHLAENIIIGLCSFVGPPTDEGMVEIAYGIVPKYEGRGYATEAARALVEYAVASGRVRTIWAHTLPQDNASTRVLLKCDFTMTGEVMHPEDGAVWRWEKKVEVRKEKTSAPS